MKKLYAFFAAALISVCAFASKEEVPTDAVLANYYDQGQVCVCIYVPNDLKCFDIVFTGTYNDWASEAASCKKFEAVENYDGWYVVAVDDDGQPEDPTKDPYANLQGKPVQLDVNGDFKWDYQVGAATVIRGAATVVEGGVAGEIDIIEYGTDAPNVYTVDAWKNDPCSAVYSTYTVAVINDGCDGFAIPFIIGSFNNWKFQQMQVNEMKTEELGAGYYEYTFRAAEGAEYYVVSGLMDPTSGDIVEQPAWADNCYIQQNVDGVWGRYDGGGSNGNMVLGENTSIVYDLRSDDLRWSRCDGISAEAVAVSVKVPAGAPEAIEIVGSFEGWSGIAMTWNASTGYWDVNVEARPDAVFKFREAGTWDNQILYFDEDLMDWVTFGDGHKELKFEDNWTGEAGARKISLDLSDAEKYKWQADGSGIEDIVLTENAKKVMVDGVLYIVRDNKLFNIQGAQVR